MIPLALTMWLSYEITMFSKFKLNDLVYLDFKEYESLGKEYYEEIQLDI